MVLMSCPCFTAIKESSKNDSLVYFDFGCLRDAYLIPHTLVESAKSCTRFYKSGAHLVIHVDRLREGAAEVGELFYHLQLLSLCDTMSWIYAHTCIHTCVCVHPYKCVCMYIYIYIYVRIYTPTHMCVHTHTHTYIHTHIYTHIYVAR